MKPFDMQEAHDSLDVLLACYLVANPLVRPSRTTVLELLHWTSSQLQPKTPAQARADAMAGMKAGGIPADQLEDALAEHLQASGARDEKPPGGDIHDSVAALGWTGRGKP